MERARSATRTTLISIRVDPEGDTDLGGHWWDVAVPEVSESKQVRTAFEDYRRATGNQIVDG